MSAVGSSRILAPEFRESLGCIEESLRRQRGHEGARSAPGLEAAVRFRGKTRRRQAQRYSLPTPQTPPANPRKSVRLIASYSSGVNAEVMQRLAGAPAGLKLLLLGLGGNSARRSPRAAPPPSRSVATQPSSSARSSRLADDSSRPSRGMSTSHARPVCARLPHATVDRRGHSRRRIKVCLHGTRLAWEAPVKR